MFESVRTARRSPSGLRVREPVRGVPVQAPTQGGCVCLLRGFLVETPRRGHGQEPARKVRVQEPAGVGAPRSLSGGRWVCVKVPVRGLCLPEPVEWGCVHHPLHEGGAIARRGGERCVYKSLLGQGVCATLLLREGCASVCTGRRSGVGIRAVPTGVGCSRGGICTGAVHNGLHMRGCVPHGTHRLVCAVTCHGVPTQLEGLPEDPCLCWTTLCPWEAILVCCTWC